MEKQTNTAGETPLRAWLRNAFGGNFTMTNAKTGEIVEKTEEVVF